MPDAPAQTPPLVAFHGEIQRRTFKGGAFRCNWKGGRRVSRDGYVEVRSRLHPHSQQNGYALEHVLVASAALGVPLPRGAVVHHIDEDRQNNRRSNLVICQDRAYHNLLHRRMRALASCGNAGWLRCCRCLKYDAPENLSYNARASQAWHKSCAANYQRTRIAR